MLKSLLTFSVLGLAATAAQALTAEEILAKKDQVSAEELGKMIAEEADRRDLGWGTVSQKLTMTLTNKHGQSTTRQMRSKNLEISEEGEGDWSVMVFDTPADVKGTAFLSYSHILKADDQWLFLPALKRVKRISSRNKSGPFVGSEFSFEDLSSREVEKYTYKFIGVESCGELECFKIESYPAYKYSGYTKQVGWLDTKEFRSMKMDSYDRRGSLLKSLKSSEYQQYEGKYWRAHNMYMENHLTGKSTTLKFSNYKFKDANVRKSDFNKAALKRVR